MTSSKPTLTSAAAAEAIVRDFDALGGHRTGSPGDSATTELLIRRLSEVGVQAQAHRFRFSQLQTRRAEVQTGGAVIGGQAQMDAGLTPPGGLQAPLVGADEPRAGAIAVLDLAASATTALSVQAEIERCVQAGAAGLVVVARRGEGSLFLINAPHLSWLSPLPVLFVAPAEAGPLLEALAAGESARLVIEGERRYAEATNVVARLAADAPVGGAAPLGLMTPKSGWFSCAAERGGGIVGWLAAAEAAAGTVGRARDVVLLATAGHELGHAGLEAYLLEQPGLAVEVGFWIHLGASIGAAVGPTLALFASDQELQRRLQSALDAAGAGPYRVAPPGAIPGGEARNVQARGGRFVSLAGGHAFFHTPEDRPDKVDPESVARYARGVTTLLREALIE